MPKLFTASSRIPFFICWCSQIPSIDNPILLMLSNPIRVCQEHAGTLFTNYLYQCLGKQMKCLWRMRGPHWPYQETSNSLILCLVPRGPIRPSAIGSDGSQASFMSKFWPSEPPYWAPFACLFLYYLLLSTVDIQKYTGFRYIIQLFNTYTPYDVIITSLESCGHTKLLGYYWLYFLLGIYI